MNKHDLRFQAKVSLTLGGLLSFGAAIYQYWSTSAPFEKFFETSWELAPMLALAVGVLFWMQGVTSLAYSRGRSGWLGILGLGMVFPPLGWISALLVMVLEDRLAEPVMTPRWPKNGTLANHVNVRYASDVPHQATPDFVDPRASRDMRAKPMPIRYTPVRKHRW